MIHPEWQAPPQVKAFVTTRAFGDLADPHMREKLRAMLPDEPLWLQQVHGNRVVEFGERDLHADASISRQRGNVCAVKAADCMPVLFADEDGTTVAAAHAGWRGLAAGVLETTVAAMGIPRRKIIAWLGPAIGPRVYEVGEEVYRAFPSYPQAFVPTRPGHWLLDLYAVAREKLRDLKAITGGGFCTYSDSARFFSYRRDRSSARMAALIWFT